jgi:small-conductance mechanosensitive channel
MPENIGEDLLWILPTLEPQQWALHIAIFVWSFGLYFIAPRLFAYIDNQNNTALRVRIFRTISLLVVVMQLIDLVTLRLHQDYERALLHMSVSLIVSYIAIYLYSLATFLSSRRFGKQKTIDGKTVYVENYSTRIINLLLLGLISFIVLYILIKIWGADSLLQTTGIIGIVVGFLALTSSIWGPDLIAGLTILNSQMLEDGDVVIISGYPHEYIISRISLAYVVLYDVRSNHRTLVKNSRFLQSKIDNLSRVASTEGIRKSLVFNISYPRIEGETREQKQQDLLQFEKRIDDLFYHAFEACRDNENIYINNNKPFEYALTRTDNYSLEYTVWVFLERIPNTKITSTVRKYFIGTLYDVTREVFRSSVFEDITLATPDLSNITISNTTTATNDAQ